MRFLAMLRSARRLTGRSSGGAVRRTARGGGALSLTRDGADGTDGIDGTPGWIPARRSLRLEVRGPQAVA